LTGPQRDVRPGGAHRLEKGDSAIRTRRDIHEQVERTRGDRREEAEAGQRTREIIGAIRVTVAGAQLLVAEPVAGGDQSIVDAGRGILDQGQDRSPAVGDERVSRRGHEFHQGRPAVLHRHELAKVGGIEGPGVHHLRPVNVDDPDSLAAL
jgi:hypothetical protein